MWMVVCFALKAAIRIEIAGAFQEELYVEPEAESDKQDTAALIVTSIDDEVIDPALINLNF